MIATTLTRVPDQTAESVNEQIRHQTEKSIARAAGAGPEAIERRLEELDHEWDIERTVETMAPSFTLLGLLLGATVDRRWLILPAVVNGFLLLHAVQGWCPPIPVLRRLGVRTAAEIDEERYALKALRGDFDRLQNADGPGRPAAVVEAIVAVRR